ncbi:hypothetical protein [Trinickia mobilis]|uniref:hypothetical protein n=1 Tax=Trinickia mobilis TaxID=2816356 RepID=UPI001A90BCE3|nr:hypothetical protein [Trinickia mobilis]
MDTNTDIELLTTLEFAFLHAVELIADMDQSLSTSEGLVSVVPQVVLWMLKETSPDVIAEIEESGLREPFISLLAEYAALRRTAQKRLAFSAYSNNEVELEAPLPFRITYDHLREALSLGDGDDVRPAFRNALSSILPIVQERLQMVDEISWGDEEMAGPWGDEFIEQNDEHAEPLFDHFEAYQISEQLSAPLDNSNAPLELATIWFRSTLDSMDDGRHLHFWSTVYTSVLGEWLQLAAPFLAKSVETNGLIPAFYKAATSYVETMRDIERLWHRLSEPLRSLLSHCTVDAEEAVGIIASMLEFPEHEEAARELTARMVYAMFCRRLNPDRTTTTREPYQLLASNTVLQTIRHEAASLETCYLVDSSALPKPFEERITERQCIVVRLPEERLQLLDQLARDVGLTGLFSKMADGSQQRCNLTVNHAFWALQEQLWPMMFRFRNEVPVLYVFPEICVLVLYRFNHFVDLRRVADVPYRHWDSATLNDGEWRHAAKHYVSQLPDGTQVKPVILTKVADLTTRAPLSDWAQAMEARVEVPTV